MRCPHCAGEILDGSRFCGICGREIQVMPVQPVPTPATVGYAAMAASTPGQPGPAGVSGNASALELPVSAGARWARILAVLALDVVLAGAGLAMILSHARGCDQPERGAPAASSPMHETDTARHAQ